MVHQRIPNHTLRLPLPSPYCALAGPDWLARHHERIFQRIHLLGGNNHLPTETGIVVDWSSRMGAFLKAPILGRGSSALATTEETGRTSPDLETAQFGVFAGPIRIIGLRFRLIDG